MYAVQATRYEFKQMYVEQIDSVRQLLQLYDISVPDVPQDDEEVRHVAELQFEETKKLLKEKRLEDIVAGEVREM